MMPVARSIVEPVISLGVLGDTGLWHKLPSPNLGETRLEFVFEEDFEVLIGGKTLEGDLGELAFTLGLLSRDLARDFDP